MLPFAHSLAAMDDEHAWCHHGGLRQSFTWGIQRGVIGR